MNPTPPTVPTDPPSPWRCAAHQAQLEDHEARLRNAERDIHAAHDGIRELRAHVKSALEKMQLRVGLYALTGAVVGTLGKDVVALVRGLFP